MLDSELEKACIHDDDTQSEPIHKPGLGTWNSCGDSMLSHPLTRLYYVYIFPSYQWISQALLILSYGALVKEEYIPPIKQNWPSFHLLHTAYILPCILAYIIGSRSQVTEIPGFAPAEECLPLLKQNLRGTLPYSSYRARRSHFAVHLADPKRSAFSMLPGYSKIDIAIISIIYWVSLLLHCILLVGYYDEPQYRYLVLCAGCANVVGILVILPVFYSAGWASRRSLLAEQIRSRCLGLGMERGDEVSEFGDPKERLAWWIRGLLEEEGDLKSKGGERRKVLINPIIKIIRI